MFAGMIIPLNERLEDKVDKELGERQGILAFIGSNYPALEDLRQELQDARLLKSHTKITGPHEHPAGSMRHGAYWRLELDKADINAIVDYGVPSARVAQYYHKKAAASAPVHTTSATVSPAALAVSELQRKNIEALNALTWTQVDGGITTSVDYLSPINLTELILPFPLSGLYETRMDNRTMTRTLTLYDAAIERLEPYGFHKARAASRATPAAVSPRVENEIKRTAAIKELNRVDGIGQSAYTWSLSPHREKGIQLNIAFDDKAAAEHFRDEYLIDAGAKNAIIERTVTRAPDPVTGVYGIQHSTRTWQIALELGDVHNLADNASSEAVRLLKTISPKGGYQGRGRDWLTL